MRKMQFLVTGRPIVAATILVASAGSAQAGTHTWRGGSGDSWHLASNWSPAGVPGAGDTARIASGVVSLGSSATVGSLWVGSAAEVKSAGRLTVLGTAVSQGLVTGAGTVSIPRGATARFSVASGAAAAFRQRAGLSRAHAVALSGIENFGQASVEAAPGVRLGTVRNHAQLEIRVAGGASFTRVSNAGSLVVRGKGKRSIARGQSIRNLGRLSLQGAHVEASEGVVNERGAEVVLEGAGVVEAPSGTAPVFENHGLVVKSGAGVAEVELEWENTGQVRVEGGTLLLNEVGGEEPTQEAGRTTLDGGTLAVEGAGGERGTFVLDGGSLDGSGVINGDVVQNGGAVNAGFSPGMITINGNYLQNPDGILNMEIGGTAMGTGFDNLTVNGSAQFYGTLAMRAWGTYVPPLAGSFEILRFYSARLAWRATSLATPAATYSLSGTSSNLVAKCITSPVLGVVVATADMNFPSATFREMMGYGGGTGPLSVAVVIHRLATPTAPAAFWGGGNTWTPTYTAVANEVPTSGGSPWRVALPIMAPGQYWVRANLRDGAGRVVSVQRPFSVFYSAF